MKQYTLCELTKWELDAVWELMKKLPEFSGNVSRETLNQLLAQGKMQLWAEPDALTPVAVMVTEIQITGHGKRVNVLAFAGKNVDERRQMFASIKNWARKNGAGALRAECKDAQMRLFSKEGFVKVANVIELELNHDE